MHEISDGTTASNSPQQETPSAPPPLTDRISDALQNGVKAIIGSNRKPPRRFRSLLNGTWLGHPLHPAITDIPIGAWLLAAILDIVWLVSPDANAWAARGAEATILIGIIAAVGAAATGLTDWSDTYGSERTVGLYHAGLNTLALVLYVISLILRLGITSGESVAAAIIGFVGLVVVLVAAYLGGDMVFGKATGVNHTAWPEGSADYVPVLPEADLPENTLRRVDVAGVPVVIVKLRGKYSAIAATCSHAGGPLDEGELQGDVVQCPWHGSRFRMGDGKVLTGPATFPQPRYDVLVRDGLIHLKQA
ncbi:MAG TPA: Rieske (2Fe-2S) protein [Ktedonobacterales bacterium]